MSTPVQLNGNVKIPKSLQPKSETPTFQTEVLAVDAERRLTRPEVEELKEELGGIVYDRRLMSDLKKIGLDAEQFGNSLIDRGGLFVMQEAVIKTTTKLMEILVKTKDKNDIIRIAGCIDKLAKAVASCSLSNSLSKTSEAAIDKDRLRRASPAKGALMGQAKQPLTVTVLPDAAAVG